MQAPVKAGLAQHLLTMMSLHVRAGCFPVTGKVPAANQGCCHDHGIIYLPALIFFMSDSL
jgi:hypothetical protein